MNQYPFRYKRSGTWSSSYLFHYQCAYEALADFEKIIQTLHEKERTLKKDNSEMEPEDLGPYITNQTYDLWHEAYKYYTMIQLFACMTIEAFLNNYGTRCLGEGYYKKNMERLGITEKLSIIIATCMRNFIDKDNPIKKKVRTLFANRNHLVHPKSREINIGKIHESIPISPKELKAKEIIKDMDYILSQFCKMDPDIKFNFEFKKP
ncbi:MAG: hypothetical protein PHC61_13630 [Chitinivibrionales bacterium]|nr:hypothetical protein [Chitinivibrionales bacterium]